MNIELGDIVLYQTVPCKTPDEGQDLDLYSNVKREDRMKPINRPALVLRVFPQPDGFPTLNLRVYADADGIEDRWRTSVVHAKHAQGNGPSWRQRYRGSGGSGYTG